MVSTWTMTLSSDVDPLESIQPDSSDDIPIIYPSKTTSSSLFQEYNKIKLKPKLLYKLSQCNLLKGAVIQLKVSIS